MRLICLSFFVLLDTASLLVAAPIKLCYTNDKKFVIYLGLFLSEFDRQESYELAPGQSIMTRGDDEDPYCISPTYRGDARNCPVDEPSTATGFQVEIQCRQ